MPDSLHPLLARQLRKLELSAAATPASQAFGLLLAHVSRAYADFDQERYLLDRSQDIASSEMAVLNTALRESQAQLSSLLSLSSDWIWEQDTQGRFTFVSQELEVRSDVKVDALMGQACGVDGPLRVGAEEFLSLRDSVARRRRFYHVNFQVESASGAVQQMSISGEPLFVDGVFAGYRGVGSDVTVAVAAARRIEELARFDGLTGLVNRNMFMEELSRTLVRSERYDRRFALFFIDLDRFKLVNDNLGHLAGDALLKTIGLRLKKLLRDADLLARLGGDEFVVLSEGCCDPGALAKIASRLLSAIREPMDLDGRRIEISASVGIAVYPDNGGDALGLMQAADAAMYQAKGRGKNTFEFFTLELAQRAARHFALEGELRLAADRGQLQLHYQPKVEASTGALIGMEALLRWNHPVRGLLAPGVFVELAEESGLIVPIGRWVLHEACAQMMRWQAEGRAPVRCAVNISVRQIAGDSLLADVQSALRSSGLDPALLEVEVTESMLMADPRQAEVVLDELAALGIHVSIDDFGTGHSSLAYLKKFPVRTLKIDRSFVMDLPGDHENLAIARAVIAMGHSLGMDIVAEGVETNEQYDCLVNLGCDVLQGYLFGRPVAADTMAQWLGDSDGFRRLHARHPWALSGFVDCA